MNKPIIIGLTGPTGCGKSVVAAAFAECGVGVISADSCAREVVQPGQPCLAELVKTFTADILHSNGTLDRTKLAAVAFAEPAKTQALNRITHPAICTLMRNRAQEMFENGCKVIAFDSPQLFEAGQDADCNKTVAVLADKSLRLARIMARDGISEQAALLRMNARQDDDFNRQRADVIWENNGEAEQLRQIAKGWWEWV